MSDRVEVSGIVLEIINGGADVRMSLADEENTTHVWQWPRRGGGSFVGMGEEIAKALALIDGTFEVRRFDSGR